MRIADQMEALAQSIASAFWPMIEMVVEGLWRTLRALILALFGGVPREVAELPVPAEEAPSTDKMNAEDRPRWREAAIRRCLGRRAEGRAPRARDLAALPGDVRAWLAAISSEQAGDLKTVPDPELRAACERWRLRLPPIPPALRPEAFNGGDVEHPARRRQGNPPGAGAARP